MAGCLAKPAREGLRWSSLGWRSVREASSWPMGPTDGASGWGVENLLRHFRWTYDDSQAPSTPNTYSESGGRPLLFLFTGTRKQGKESRNRPLALLLIRLMVWLRIMISLIKASVSTHYRNIYHSLPLAFHTGWSDNIVSWRVQTHFESIFKSFLVDTLGVRSFKIKTLRYDMKGTSLILSHWHSSSEDP